MFKKMGDLIVKRPWLVITLILTITIGFSTLLPSIEMKTDYNDFMPNDEIVKANMRIPKYFGKGQQSMFVYIKTKNSNSTLSPESIREQEKIKNKLLEAKEIEDTLDITLFIDQVCQLEYGKKLEECTDEEIIQVLNDILKEKSEESIKILEQNDPDEEIDYKKYEKISKGKKINEIDIKNAYIEHNNEILSFSIEVYDLKAFESKLKSPISSTNVVEWFIDFENEIKPDERLDISYRIAAHIEPKHAIWEVGKGPLKNIQTLLSNLLKKELFNQYKKEAYLWIRPPGETIYFPILLETGNIIFDTNNNLIKIEVSKKEMSKYGISAVYGSIVLPTKLSNFKIGSRYYENPGSKLPWLRFTYNTSFLIDSLEKIQGKPLLSDIAENILKKNTDLTWEDFDKIFNTPNEFIETPEQVSILNFESNYINADEAFDETSDKTLFIKPDFYNDLRIGIESLISDDYEKTGKPSAALMVLYLNVTGGYQGVLDFSEELLQRIDDIDGSLDYLTIKVTGDGIVSYEMDKVTNEANQIIIPTIFIIIILILYISFRKLSYVFVPMLSLIVSVIWLFGTMVLLGIAFSTIAVALVPLILGLGVDYSVHLSHSYRGELAKGKTPAEAIKISVLEIGNAMFLAMLTTVIAFLSFLSASLPPIRDFGLLLAFGISYTFVTAITLQAAIRYLSDRRKKQFNNRTKKNIKLDIFMGKMADGILNNQKKIITIIVKISIIACFGAIQIKTSFNFNSFIPQDNPALIIYEEIEKDFPSSGQDQEYILIEGEVASVNTLDGIRKTHFNINDDKLIGRKADGTANINSIYSIIQQAVNSNNSLINRFNLDEDTYIPKSDRDVKDFYNYLWESEEYSFTTQSNLHKTENGNYDATVIRVFIDIISESRASYALAKDLAVLTDEFNEDLEDYGNAEAIVTGQYIIWHLITTSLTDSQILSTCISLVLAGIVLIIAYRRPTLGLIAMIPVLVSILWILGTMYFIGYTLNIMTITVTSLTIGIGIDYAIHTTERFRLVADKTGDIKMAVSETVSRTGGALLIAALTTTFGFGTLIFAPIPPEQQFGVITAMTISYSFITSVLLLPLILAKWAKITKKRRGYIISPSIPGKSYLDGKDMDKNKENK